MKIGLIGNMNNNNFAMMRFLRDLCADAHLLLYSTDGKGMLSRVTPEAVSDNKNCCGVPGQVSSILPNGFIEVLWGKGKVRIKKIGGSAEIDLIMPSTKVKSLRSRFL